MAGMRSRHQLLAAAASLIATNGWDLVTGALPAAAVCKRAGLTRRTYYDNFPTTEDFAEALREYICGTSHNADAAAMDDALARGDIRSAVAALIAVQKEEVERDPVTAMAQDVANLMGGQRRDPWVVTWRSLLDGLVELGFVLRPPHEVGALARRLSAMVAGELRGEGAIDQQELGEMVLAVLAGLFVPAHVRDNQAPVEELVQHCLVATRERSSTPAVVHVRRLVLDAVSALVLERGVLGLSLANLAQRTGFSTTMIGKHVGSANDILLAVADEPVAGLDVMLQADLATTRVARELQARHLQRFSDYCSAQLVAAHAVVAIALSRRPTTPLPGRIGAMTSEWARLFGVSADELWQLQVQRAAEAVLVGKV